MSDNVKVNPSLNNAAISVATDDIDNVHYPVYKLAIGPDGTAEHASADAPLPVSIDAISSVNLINKLDELLTELKILNAYNALGHGETLTEEDTQ